MKRTADWHRVTADGKPKTHVAAEGFFGMLEREAVNRRHCRSIAEARNDPFDYIERFHDPHMQRRPDVQDEAFRLLTQPSVKTG